MVCYTASMRRQQTAIRGVAVAVLATLLLRASIPDGYMPAPVGSGLLFELCPARVPAGLMRALSGSASHHDHSAGEAAGAHFDAAQCPIGHLLSAAAAIDTQRLEPDVPTPAGVQGPAVRLRASARLLTRRSRGPPT